MGLKNAYRIFLMTIFVLGTISLCYADSGPNIGENQAKSIANNYLQSHNLPYHATTATLMYKIKNKDTGTTKLVSVEKWDAMTGGNKEEVSDPNFPWDYAWDSTGKFPVFWKIAVADPQGNRVGNIWINANSGKVLKFTRTTIGMERTGIPLIGMALAILMIAGGLISTRKK